MTPQEIADRYFSAMIAQEVEALITLFTPDGVIVWPDGTTLTGHDAIRQAYTGMFTRPTNNPTPGPLMIAPGQFAAEVFSKLPDGSERRTINVFYLSSDGRLAKMHSSRRD